jgi:hypothetical protein
MSGRVLTALGLGLCTLLVLAPPSAARARRAGRLPGTCFRRATEPAVAACLRPSFRRVAATGQVRSTLDELDAAVRRGQLDDCHALAHELAHVVVARVKSVDRALGLGGTQCSDGYQHGVVEAAAGLGATPRTCARRPSEELRDACFHALGHRYMYEAAHDVSRALGLCRSRIRRGGVDRCADGVLMENSMQFMRLGGSLYALHAPHACDGLRLREQLRFTCYAEIGEVGMFVYRHRLARVRPVCARVGTRYGRRACLQGARDELELARANRSG